jgi:hypothetical protein
MFIVQATRGDIIENGLQDYLGHIVFVLGKPSRPCVMLVSKARAYPKEASFRCSTIRNAPGFTHIQNY